MATLIIQSFGEQVTPQRIACKVWAIFTYWSLLVIVGQVTHLFLHLIALGNALLFALASFGCCVRCNVLGLVECDLLWTGPVNEYLSTSMTLVEHLVLVCIGCVRVLR